MTYDQYMMEHGIVDFLPDIDDASIVGRCNHCGEDIDLDDCYYISDYAEAGKERIRIHKRCLKAYIDENYNIEDIAEALGYNKYIGG